VAVFDSQTLAQTASYEVGKNPAALALSPDRRILYVAASDDDWIDRIDLQSGAALQPLQLTQPGAAGQYSGLSISPNALAVDGARLYVSAAMLNAVLVIDTATGAQIGAIPAGVRPTGVAVSQGALYVLNSRGAQDNGTLQRISPIPADLTGPTATVARLNALPRHEYEPPDADCATIGPLPATRGGDASLSKIKHVVMVLKENKTFDAVFGDFPGAEADRRFLQWGARVTPNQHELAHQFCLLDNFYDESEQSVEGHFWATAQVTTDYFERTWAATWGGRVTGPMPLPPAGLQPLDSPRGGFIFDALARAGIPYLSYGEFVGTSGDLAAHIDTRFVDLPFNFLARPDTEKLPLFLATIAAGKLQPFTFIALQYDHTFGLSPGMPSPEYMIADNDLATGRLVEAISHSRYWEDTLILITEDDPSGAADHVDPHRSFALVVSPYARRGRVSHVRASFPSLAATWQRALGVKPLSALDAQAEPLWDCLTETPDKTAFTALPGNVPKTINPARPGLRALDFSAVDRARGLGIQLWQAARPGEPVPIRILRAESDDDAD
jgi:YVTN family beta-propeller protein